VARSKLNVLVVGVDGLIGQALVSELRKRGHGVVGTSRRSRHGDDGTVFLDLSAARLASLPSADIMIICAAMARFSDCRDHYDLTRHVNVEARLALADLARARGERIIAMSSSAVFDCMRPNARADWKPAPRSAYGRQMAESEAGILARRGAILRSTKILTDRAGVFPEWILTLRSGGTVRAFEDHTLCPVPLNSVVDSLIAIAEQPSDGIFQVSGASDISFAEAARHLARRIGVCEDRVASIRAVDHGIPKSELTPHTSLDTSRLTELWGFQPPEPFAVMDAVFHDLLSERGANLEA
jgi:dTDP-4-dehydrorhamnose reductase